MGYYTTYQLDICHGKIIDQKKFEEDFSRITDGLDFNEEFYDLKWYDHEEHMTELSQLYPNVTFRLYGDGESYDDNWVMYFCNGERDGATAELVYPEVDTASLGGMKQRNPELFI